MFICSQKRVMRRFLAVFLSVLAFFAVAPMIGSAQSVCAEKAAALRIITLTEELVAMGISADGSLVQVYASDKGTFTVVTIRPDSPLVCFMAMGTDWQMKTAKPAGKDS